MRAFDDPTDAPPVLVLAPGMLCDAASWAPQAGMLGGETEVRIADYGSARTLTGMAQALMADAPARFALAGHSMGGRVAMEVARLAPERLTGLCLISADPLPKPLGEAGLGETRARHELIDLARGRGMAAVAGRLLPALIHPGRMIDAHLVQTIEAMIACQDPDILERQVAAGEGRPDHRGALAAVDAPALVICGAEDGFGRAPWQASMAALLPDAAMLLIERCGHMPMLEAPETVSQAMRGWLDRIRLRAPEFQAAL
jgi:pimeloyl-ACP methyl ester carboxylesterase